MTAETTRPIVGIENRTAQEVFDIMCDRITRAAVPVPPAGGEGEPDWLKSRDPFFIEGWRAARAQPPAGEVDWPLRARVWTRESTGEKVLEITGTINDTFTTSRHTQPLDVPDECVPGLPTLYAHPTEPAARDGGEAAVQYEVWQDDILVASSDTLSDAQHFAMIHRQDDPAEIVVATTYRVPLAAGGEK